MSQAIRDAAQALLKAHDSWATIGEIKAGWDALRDALSAQQPTADERVAEHMRLVREHAHGEWESGIRFGKGDCSISPKRTPAYEAVKASARALLSASQEDADTKRVEWMFAHRETGADEMTFENSDAWRAWVDVAMKEAE